MERQLSDASEQQGDSRPDDPTDDMFGGKNVLRMEIPIQNIEIDQEKGKPRLNKKDFKSEIFEKVMALRNSGGGVLIIRNQNYDGVDKTNDPLYKDQFTTMVSDGMQQMATYRGEVGEFQSWYRSVWKGDGKWLLYYIKEGLQLTFPLESKVYTVNENNHRKVGIEEIQRRLLQSTETPPNYHPSVTHVHCDEKHGELRLGKKCSYLHESTNIQLKSFNDINSMCKNIREYTTAFCQNKNGGSMCFGIEEKQNSETKQGSTCSKTPVVCGVQFNKDDDAIRQEIKKTMSEKMLWIRHNGENADPDEICQYYDVRFHNVDPENRSKKVIEVSVAKFYGCVFSDEPKPCYLDGGEIKYYTVKEWVQILMKDHLKGYSLPSHKENKTSEKSPQKHLETTEIHADLRPLIDQTVLRIEREKEEKFFETKAFHDIQEKLRKNRVIMIKGNTGDGKTSTAIQLMDWLIKEQPCRQPLQLHDIKKLDKLSPDSNLVTFIDDIFGEKNEVREWNKRINDVKTIFGDEQSKPNFLLVTIRNEVYNVLQERSFGALFTEDNIIDLSSDKYNTADERRNFLELHKPNGNFSWKDEEKEKIINSSPKIGFPQCCKLFNNSKELQKRRVQFFENPVEFIAEALSRLSEGSVILFLFLNGGEIKVKDLDPNSDKINKTLLDESFDISLNGGEDDRTSLTYKKKIGFVKEGLDRLLGFLVVKVKYLSGDEVYRFNHDSVHVTVALLYWNKTPVGYIQNCPVKSLDYLTISEKSSNKIVISTDYYTCLGERILREFELQTFDVTIGSLDVWKNQIFVERFFRLVNERNVGKLVLNEACSYGAKECALYLLNQGVKPDKDTDWWSLITGGWFGGNEGDVDVLEKVEIYLDDKRKLDMFNEACLYGAVECALYLLSEGVVPDKDTQWWSLITGGMFGDGKGDEDVLKKVVKNLNDERKLDLFNKACLSGSVECALYLLSEGVKPDKDPQWWPLITGGMFGDGKGDEDVLKKVVQYLNDERKLDLFYEACLSGSVKCALYLLSEGVKPDEDTQWWPLITGGMFGDGKGDEDVLKKVVQYLNDERKLDLFYEACLSGSVKCTLYLLSEGVKPDEDTQWWSLITGGRISDGKGDVDVLKKVVQYLNDERKLDLFNKACLSGSVKCALYLLHDGVKPDEDTQWWPLITGGRFSDGKGDEDVLKKVVKNLNDERKLDLFNKACLSGSVECALYLLREGVKPDKDPQWWPLITGGMFGDGKGDEDVLKKVVKNLNDERKLDLFNKACLSGSVECALYLLRDGVKPDEDTQWWPLITGGRFSDGKGDVDVLKKVVKYLNDKIKLDLWIKVYYSGSEECALFLLQEKSQCPTSGV